jgi:hypothetical protein
MRQRMRHAPPGQRRRYIGYLLRLPASHKCAAKTLTWQLALPIHTGFAAHLSTVNAQSLEPVNAGVPVRALSSTPNLQIRANDTFSEPTQNAAPVAARRQPDELSLPADMLYRRVGWDRARTKCRSHSGYAARISAAGRRRDQRGLSEWWRTARSPRDEGLPIRMP